MKKIVIIGAGVSGLVSSIKIKDETNEVILLEKNKEAGKKILVTGNGRCNFLNDDFTSNHFHSVSNYDLDNLIKDESKNKILDFINELKIEYKIKNGYYYPFTNKAVTVRDALIEEALKRKVKIIYNYEVKEIKKEKDKFIINNDIESDYLIMASGSKSYPKTGSSGDSYTLLKELGHSVTDLYPSLVQITTEGKFLKKLSGVRTDAIVSINLNDEKIKEEYGELQFTDYGVSGICVFNLSRYVSYMNKGKLTIKINLMPFLKEDANKYLENRSDNISIYDMLKRIINEKIVRVILDELKINYDINYVSLDKNKKESLIEYLTCFTLNVTGTKSFDNSQVTAGGIPLSEININTFESKIVNNLFLLGELLDVDGDCGGYNISFAILSSLISSEYIRGKND